MGSAHGPSQSEVQVLYRPHCAQSAKLVVYLLRIYIHNSIYLVLLLANEVEVEVELRLARHTLVTCFGIGGEG